MSHQPAPIFKRIRDVFDEGFTINWFIASFITLTHVAFIVGTPLAFYFAPEGFWKIMLAWMLVHALVACLSTTVYAHRLVAHRAAKVVRWPVHLIFGFVGQVLAVQGSVRKWAAKHVVHHGVDKTGKHILDPYSATWFPKTWQNFLWSHTLTYYFNRPDTQAEDKAYAALTEPMIVWQDKLYFVLVWTLNFVLPFVIGMTLTGAVLGGVCLLIAAIGGFIIAQHNTWTVNSVTHLWGPTDAATSSAKNNYVWMGPLGEGNHHADHHDQPRDYRNGFGWSGWLLDPTRYVILLMKCFGLVGGLQRASRSQEARIIANRKLSKAQKVTANAQWLRAEERLGKLRADWVEATKRWESYKAEKLAIANELKSLSSHRLQEKREELLAKKEEFKRSIENAKAQMLESRRLFLQEVTKLYHPLPA